mgnify:CR=1 FL=1
MPGPSTVPKLSTEWMRPVLHALMEGAGDDLVLLLPGQLVEVDRVAGHPDGELGVLLRVGLGVQQGLLGEHVDVQMVAALFGVAVQQGDQVVNLGIGDVHGILLLSGMGCGNRVSPLRR